jgi:DNA-binding NarL/FixJ family response regulator
VQRDKVQRLKNFRAIIVEDDSLAAIDLIVVLQHLGYTVLGHATTLEEGFSLVRKSEGAVALLDIDLGGTSVRPLVTHLRQEGNPLIFVTGVGGIETLDREPIVLKPFTPGQIDRALRLALDRPPLTLGPTDDAL